MRIAIRANLTGVVFVDLQKKDIALPTDVGQNVKKLFHGGWRQICDHHFSFFSQACNRTQRAVAAVVVSRSNCLTNGKFTA